MNFLTKKSTIAIILTLVAIFLHTYLTIHFYPVKFGAAIGDSACNLNALFNCDSVAASGYSTFINIPLAVWGMATNIILLFFLLVPAFGLTAAPQKFVRASYLYSSFILLSSLVMGVISIMFLTTYCIFCIGAYVISILSFEIIRRMQNDYPELKDTPFLDIKELKMPIIGFLAIALVSFVAHESFSSSYENDLKISGRGSLDSFIHRSVKKWESATKYEFNDADALVLGDKNAPITIVEFADFLCSHCQKAAPSLHAFAQAHKDVKLVFYAFPLDGSCNNAIKRKGGAERCKIAKATYCANTKGFGWEMHDHMFQNQRLVSSHDSIDAHIKKVLAKDFPMLPFETFQECLNSEETHEAILRHAKLGEEALVEGTPAIYMQGKKLDGGQIHPILDAVYKTIKK